MERYSFVLVCLSIVIACTSIEVSNLRSNTSIISKNRLSFIDVLIGNLQGDVWETQDLECYNQMLTTLHNVKNFTLWAVWAIDSIQFPNGLLYGSKYQLGNYDATMKAPWLETHPKLKTQYCLADIKLNDIVPQVVKKRDPYDSAQTYINSKTNQGRELGTIIWGVTVPASCSTRAVSTLVKVFLHSSVYGAFSTASIQISECQVPRQKKEYGVGFYAFWCILLSLFIICLLSTCYLVNNDCRTSDCITTKLIQAFCMNRNSYELVKPCRDDIPVLHAVRAISALIIVLMHQVFFSQMGAIVNGLDVDKLLDMLIYVNHADLLTDTFLLLSGLLLARSLYAKKKLGTPTIVILKRYIRMVVQMMTVVFFIAAVFINTSNGPIWSKLAGIEEKTCAKNWWLNLLMIHNYINKEEMCYITSWYAATNFQLSILGVALIYLCRRNRRVGMFTVAVVTVLSVLLPGYTTYVNELPATMMWNIETINNIRTNRVFYSYIQSHYRMGSYLVGLAAGYLMSVYNPDEHKKVISKKWSIFSFTVMFIVAWIPMALGGVFHTREYNVVEVTVFAALNRIVWALAICSLVFILVYGDLPILTRFFCWNAWVPLSRLSYGLYLTHPAIILHNVYSVRAPLTEHIFNTICRAFGVIVIGFIISWMMWLLVHAPTVNVANLILFPSKKIENVYEKKENDLGNGDLNKKEH